MAAVERLKKSLERRLRKSKKSGKRTSRELVSWVKLLVSSPVLGAVITMITKIMERR
ncbi:hypothetical protein [Streptomyces olivaceiscleroticus]|uniref:Uncharacterized protein n=1 Tax=Streptomyces olivaceiscleroticus TaxID=68245 RepID=A0ABN0ZNW9_9ACTN